MDKLLIVGCGSIGQRHIQNFKAAGVRHLVGADPKDDRLKLAAELGLDRTYRSYQDALSSDQFDAVVVCTPPHLHVPVSLAAAEAGSHLFIEKPLAASLDQVDDLIAVCRRKALVGLVGYCYRFLRSVEVIREILDSKQIGHVLSARIWFSSYLPDWHPWEDYRSFYMARKEQGGGALLDESHGLDLLRWLLGELSVVHATIERVSDLEITTDDLAVLVLRTGGGAVVEAHFDLLGRSPRIGMEIIGAEGTVLWDREAHRVDVYRSRDRRWRALTFREADYAGMYRREVEHFVSCVENGVEPVISIADAKKTLELLLEAVDLSTASQRASGPLDRRSKSYTRGTG